MKLLYIILIIIGVLVLGIVAGYLIIKKINEPWGIIVISPDCDADSYKCDDFESQVEAQQVFEYCGGIDNDVHQLDRDGNGLACEGLQ